jgi:hypothetical protein
MRALYTAEVTAHGGREGHVRSSDGILDIDLRIPKGIGGPGGPATNPEQLFAAGYAACFESALRGVARCPRRGDGTPPIGGAPVCKHRGSSGGYLHPRSQPDPGTPTTEWRMR